MDIRYSDSLQGLQVFYPVLGILKSWLLGPGVLDPGSQVLGYWVPGLGSCSPGCWVLILDYAEIIVL